jgi:hypothetical protein
VDGRGEGCAGDGGADGWDRRGWETDDAEMGRMCDANGARTAASSGPVWNSSGKEREKTPKKNA